MKNRNVINLVVGPFATNCWIYPYGEKGALIIDPGEEAELIISTIKKYDLIPEYILLTHGHFDHIGAVPGLAAAFSSLNLEIAIHKFDSDYLGSNAYKTQSASMKAAIGSTSLIDDEWKDMPQATRLLEEGDTVGPFTVLHLPGHTQGSVAFWDKEEGNLFTGDTLFEGDYGRTDLPGGNMDEIIASLRRLLAMDAAIKVYPGHGNTTTIGREKEMLG
ncbi:MAG: MBL fold metallo-hydrolase [Treponema sp.]|jgi:glyoxylase-like metal-dependent hydrolase (beta-lactamase superfamily II)|nr:MBL fold metallo-hydrolase [Treponema sp.]